MVRWRYKVVVHKVLGMVPEKAAIDDLDRSAMLDQYGGEGWELVAVVNQNYRRDTDPTVLYGYTILTYHFKKPIEADNPSPLP